MNIVNFPILVVDDDSDDRYLIHKAFQEINAANQLKIIDSVKQMIQFLTQLPEINYPLLILLDYHMPGMNGEEALTYLKSDKKFCSIPVALYSTEMTAALSQKLQSLGAVGCYKKAVTVAQNKSLAQSLLAMLEHSIAA